MVFLTQAFVFLVVAVSIQSTLGRTRPCPTACPLNYEPICGVDKSGKVRRIFSNKCELNVANCLNSNQDQSIEWHPCSLAELLTGNSFTFGNFNNTSLDNFNFGNTNVIKPNTPKVIILTGNSISFGFGDNSNDKSNVNVNGNDNENGINNTNNIHNAPREVNTDNTFSFGNFSNSHLGNLTFGNTVEELLASGNYYFNTTGDNTSFINN